MTTQSFLVLFAVLTVAYAVPDQLFGHGITPYHEDTIPHSHPKYSYDYVVKDAYGNDYGKEESRDGYDTKGSYYVLLPDGRRQVVTYYVSGDSGFVADVTYEGEPHYPPYEHDQHHGILHGKGHIVPEHHGLNHHRVNSHKHGHHGSAYDGLTHHENKHHGLHGGKHHGIVNGIKHGGVGHHGLKHHELGHHGSKHHKFGSHGPELHGVQHHDVGHIGTSHRGFPQRPIGPGFGPSLHRGNPKVLGVGIHSKSEPVYHK